MVAGRAPFAGATAADVIASVLEKEPPPLAQFAPEIPEALEWIIIGDWPLWLNDNRRLLFVSQGKILLLDTRTRKYQPVLPVTDEDVDIGSPGLTRDNRMIYFTFVAAEADIWLRTLE